VADSAPRGKDWPDAPIRVLLIVTRLEVGGAQRVVLHTAAHLDRAHFVVGLAWGPGELLDPEAEAIPDLERTPVADLVRTPSPLRDRRAVADLRRAIRRFRPDVVHTHSSKAGILGRLAARLEGVPTVVHTVHGFGFTPLQPLPLRAAFFLAERLAARWTDHMVAVSERNLQRGAELGLLDPERASVIRAGVALARFRNPQGAAAARARLEVTADALLVTQIGNFKPQKAPLDFVRLAAEVARRVPAARFVMLGEGPLRGAAEALARRLGVAERMVFPGWWDDVPAILAASRVSVLTSRHEGLPCAVVESLAAGVPVVATAVDGTVEVVRDGGNGFLVDPGDIATLAARVEDLLVDDILHARVAAAAPAGLEEFDIDRMVRRHEELYRWLRQS
jgi:glycosyltransferase involved in cell wall biosynthesis